MFHYGMKGGIFSENRDEKKRKKEEKRRKVRWRRKILVN